MKKGKNILNVLMIMTLLILINNRIVFADPNSSKGFLSYTEEQAQEEREELIKAQENSNAITPLKSTNNYLKELSVDGYKITPDFDKQTINYELKKEVKADTIVINAQADDKNATVTGIGEILLKDGENEIRIEVTAESGTVRTYLLKVVKKDTNEISEEKKEESNRIIIIIIAVVLVILILIFARRKVKQK